VISTRIRNASIVAIAAFALAQAASAKDEKSIERFTDAIIKLSWTVDPAEAEQVATISHHMSRQLAHDYRIVGPPPFQNFLIHIGVRQKGFCYHFTHDIGVRLKELKLRTLDLHWGASDEGTRLESNCVVVTARGQAFNDGYIMDGWRMAGRLCWWPVSKDSAFLWKENMTLTAWLQDSGQPEQKAPEKTAAQ
jgi:hypothetical protein